MRDTRNRLCTSSVGWIEDKSLELERSTKICSQHLKGRLDQVFHATASIFFGRACRQESPITWRFCDYGRLQSSQSWFLAPGRERLVLILICLELGNVEIVY